MTDEPKTDREFQFSAMTQAILHGCSGCADSSWDDDLTWDPVAGSYLCAQCLPAEIKLKACVDCVHCYYDLAYYCGRPTEDLVRGSGASSDEFCDRERDNEARCGREGRFWQPRPAKPRSFWSRLLNFMTRRSNQER